MSAEIYDYRKHAKPKAAWENMERMKLALEDCVSLLDGEISGPSQRDGIVGEAKAALAACELAPSTFCKSRSIYANPMQDLADTVEMPCDVKPFDDGDNKPGRAG